MKDPEEALAAARRAAGSSATPPAPWDARDPGESARQLAEWAIIAPDEAEVRSTRRSGRPITAIKLLLVRLLRQYVGQMTAQQSRFNAQVAAHIVRLEERVAELEETVRQDRGEDEPPPA